MSLFSLRFALSGPLVLTLALACCSPSLVAEAYGDTLSRSAGQQPSFIRVAQTSEAAVVNILTTQKEEWRPPMHPFLMPGPFGDDSFEEISSQSVDKQLVQGSAFLVGSGFLISSGGDIVTNYHVIKVSGQSEKNGGE